ncbi:hypothetical protein FVE85_2014 [Porphyridium purpureum]|uniref:Uncharacterized protein n=1 Tax=Porphyridium purpureum TaxID=35688 RepID=A0A5J4YWC6_PORPP|nr:hypothetical protein FVE85_2014 [Porphyridium purpureum]|eukprot:POR0563..scf209_3
MKFRKRTLSAVAGVIALVAMILTVVSLPLRAWLTYPPPIEFEGGSNANSLVNGGTFSNVTQFYYETLGLWQADIQVVIDLEEQVTKPCTVVVIGDCRILDPNGQCGTVFIKAVDMLVDESTCRIFRATRGLTIASLLVTVISFLFFAISIGRSSPSNSLGAGVSMVVASVLAFTSVIMWATLKNVTNFRQDTFDGTLSTGFGLLVGACMLAFISATIAIVIAEKGKSQQKQNEYTLMWEDGDDPEPEPGSIPPVSQKSQ